MAHQSSLASYLREIGQFQLLNGKEELELGRRIREEGDMAARDQLINCNLRLVVAIAKPYRTRGNHNIPLEDLIADGNVGLITAVDKYDYKLGYRFSTCAVPWIKQAIMKGIMDKSRTVRVPAHVIQLFNNYKKACDELAQEYEGESFSQADIARKMGITVEKLQEVLTWKQNSISMDTPLGDDKDADTIGDMLADNNQQSPLEYTEEVYRHDFINKIVNDLDPRTRTIFKLRFGLGTPEDPEEYGKEHTLEEIGAMLTPKITRERVRQIVAQQIARWKTQYADQELADL